MPNSLIGALTWWKPPKVGRVVSYAGGDAYRVSVGGRSRTIRRAPGAPLAVGEIVFLSTTEAGTDFVTGSAGVVSKETRKEVIVDG